MKNYVTLCNAIVFGNSKQNHDNDCNNMPHHDTRMILIDDHHDVLLLSSHVIGLLLRLLLRTVCIHPSNSHALRKLIDLLLEGGFQFGLAGNGLGLISFSALAVRVNTFSCSAAISLPFALTTRSDSILPFSSCWFCFCNPSRVFLRRWISASAFVKDSPISFSTLASSARNFQFALASFPAAAVDLSS